MDLSTKLFSILALTSLALSLSSATGDANAPMPNGEFTLPPSKIFVHFVNNVGPGINVGVHCKSKDDDLGIHVLAPQGEYGFRFKTSVLGNTLYFCSFVWNSQTHWFDGYNFKRDTSSSYKCTDCYYSILEQGPCRFNPGTGKFDICFHWN